MLHARMGPHVADARRFTFDKVVSTAVITVPLQLSGVCTANLIEPINFGITQVFTVAHNEVASEAERLASAAVSGRNSAAILLGCSAQSARDVFGGKASAGLSTCGMCVSNQTICIIRNLHRSKVGGISTAETLHVNIQAC